MYNGMLRPTVSDLSFFSNEPGNSSISNIDKAPRVHTTTDLKCHSRKSFRVNMLGVVAQQQC